jgi:hypothetical protein
MKATRPFSQPEPALCVEHVLLSTSHSKARSSTKKQLPNSIDVSPSIEEVEFRVVSHEPILQASPTIITCEDVEIQTWSNVTHLFYQSIEVPLHEVEDNDFYVLITETSDNWVL